jgi:hypothetical protein
MKDLTLYQEALALKQLGFDEPCFGWFASDRTLVKEVTEKTDFTLAPTYSQAFRWFREKYDYDISIRGASFRANWVIGVPLLINNDSKDGYPLVISWDYKTSDGMKVLTYEEAELACLQHLIKIVKERQK